MTYLIMNKIKRHEQKFTILEFGVSEKALSNTIFWKNVKKNGKLVSIDINDYNYHFKSKN